MRVVAGKHRSRPLISPKNKDVRPTTDMIKESIFNIIQNDVVGSKFLDLFAGSGAIGIEAISRGADKVVFVDNSKESIELSNK
ncbi:MAG: RsmD family RNA methyltransferase, partial [Clostridia bacterium]|nr:RsmD family RNA methyltransferase [Clostridia bacterium]